MSNSKKDEPQDTYLAEGIIFGMLLGVGLSSIITFILDTIWLGSIVLPGFCLLLGTVVGMNIKKK